MSIKAGTLQRTRRGKPVPEGQWYWPDQRDPSRHRGPHHLGRRPGCWRRARYLLGRVHRLPSARRAYALRSRIRCKVCKRRMCGATKTHPARPGQSNTYYVCQYDPANPRHAAAAPDHPRTVSAREDVLLAVLRDFLTAYTLTPGRKERLAELLPADAAAKKAQTDSGRRPAQAAQADRHRPGQPHPRPAYLAHRPSRHRRPRHARPDPRPLHRPAPPARNHRNSANGPDHRHRPRRRHRRLLDELSAAWTTCPTTCRPNCSPRSTSRWRGTSR